MIATAQQVAEFMGAQWLNACGQVDAETTGARWAVHGLQLKLGRFFFFEKHDTKWIEMVQMHQTPRNAEASRVPPCSLHFRGKIPETQLPGVWGKAHASAFTLEVRLFEDVENPGEDWLCSVHRRPHV